MAHVCKRCDHEPFDTSERLKNHSRVHALTCTVKFLRNGGRPGEADTLHRDAATQSFTCSRCLDFQSRFASRMQAHCKSCRERSASGPSSGAEPIAPENENENDERTTEPIAPENENDDRTTYIASHLGFFVNRDLRIAICRPCQAWVEVGSIQQHQLRTHKVKIDPDLLSADVTRFQLDRVADAFGSYLVPSPALKEPVEGLPVLRGLSCSLCTFYTAKQSTLRVHLRKAHGLEDAAAQPTHGTCFVQRLSLTPGKNSWFGVRPPASVAPRELECGRLLEIVARDARERREDVVTAPRKDARQVPLYMKMLHFGEFLDALGGDTVAMAPLVAAHATDDARFFPDRLRNVCAAVMDDFQSNIAAADSLLRRKLKSTKAGHISAVPFMRLDQSRNAYVATLVHLVLVLMRSLDRSRSANDGDEGLLRVLVPLDGPVRASLRDLWNAARTGDEDDPLLGPRLEESKVHCIRLLEALFFRHRRSHLLPETSFLAYRFVLFAAIQHSRVLAPDDVTHRISRMMYWCRSLVLWQIVRAPRPPPAPGAPEGVPAGDAVAVPDDVDVAGDDRHPHLHLHAIDVEHDPEADDGSGAGDAVGMGNDTESHLLMFVREDRRTPFAAILEAKRLVSSVTKNEPGLPKVTWLGDAQVVGGAVVDVGAVSEILRRSIGELHAELRTGVLLGMPAYRSNKVDILCTTSGGKMEDDLHDNTAGHWFVSNPRNRCSGYVTHLIRHIVRDAALRARFVDRVDDGGGRGNIVWRRDALSQWMHGVGQWLRKLLCVAHLLAGQPARGTEFLTCTTRNTPAQIRGVYYVEGLVMLLCLYGKGDNLRGNQRPVARFLCRDTSFLLINYLTYVREMEGMASQVLYGPERTLLYGHMLAVTEGRPMTSTDLTEGISALFLAHVHVPVGLRTWRHMAIAWIHRFLKYTRMSDLTGNGAVDSQAGHSQRVASRCYARSNFDHPGLGRDELQLYRLLSVEWHGILGLSSDALPPTPAAAAPTCSAPPRTAPVPSHPVPSPGTPLSASVAPPATPPDRHHHHHHLEVRVVHSPGHVGIAFPSLACSEAALRGLLSLGHARFKSPHQAEAAHRILKREEDLLVVLPTGGGKTLLFLLPAVVESGRLTTVVVCPFVALKKEMERRVREAHLSMCIHSEDSAIAAPVDILLVSVENCLSPSLQSHLTWLHAGGRLGRIVVDECHLAVTATAWRPALRDLAHVRKLPVPLLLLSATVPPAMEGDLREFFRSRMSVVRASTNRPNIAYLVRRDFGAQTSRLLAVMPPAPPAPRSIVFCRSVESTEDLARRLRERGFSAVHYHGQLDGASKSAAHDAWTSGTADVMVATGAFGTGVDLGAVRLVVHVDDPYGMIDLAQESGRAGRDGAPCKHVVLLKKTWRPRAQTSTELVEYLSGSQCRRWALQQYVDGHGVDCFSSASEMCDLCESALARLRPDGRRRAPGPVARAADGDDGGPPPTVGGDAPGATACSESPTKRLCTADALFSESADETRRRHAAESLLFLKLARYLKENVDKCIVCVLRKQPTAQPPHDLPHCAHLQDACFKCLSVGSHGCSTCPNRLPWKAGVHRVCFGCGLPASLGPQVLHPEEFGPRCGSMANDKLFPVCWYVWRNPEEFAEVLATSGCPPDLEDLQFADWLTGSHITFRTNANLLFVSYIQSISESE